MILRDSYSTNKVRNKYRSKCVRSTIMIKQKRFHKQDDHSPQRGKRDNVSTKSHRQRVKDTKRGITG